MNKSTSNHVRTMTATAMLSAVGFILMFFELSVPLMPSFIKLDLSELPALIGSYAFGPVAGVVICLIKNLLHLLVGNTGGVGELSNFLLGACFVAPAGLVYRRHKTKRRAILGALLGVALMAGISVLTNYYVVYPAYYRLFMSEETVLSLYQVIAPGMKSVLECLIKFNVPFNLVKGLISVGITMLIYKPLSPILKGSRQ